MLSRVTPVLVLLAIGAVPAAVHVRDPGFVTVHEWGTFTSVAGDDGEPVRWSPLTGAQDLPCFVDRSRTPGKLFADSTVRMETPVLYFYTPRETTIDVKVTFKQGLITELFPRAVSSPRDFNGWHFRLPGAASAATWSNVKLTPGAREAFPRESAANHYYAARATDATPLQVGPESEKFLFYRGIGEFPLPLTARIDDNGVVRVRSLGGSVLPAVVLFENRGGRIGYTIRRSVAPATTIDSPALDGRLDALAADLERLLVAQGLYVREARAMIETWRDSWFVEGTRLFYVVPPRVIDRVLPLEISPAPAATARVFVGRVELNAPATKRQIAAALAAGDTDTLLPYGRFLRPFTSTLMAASSLAERRRIEGMIESVYHAARRNQPVCN